MSSAHNFFDVQAPCRDCPFRQDILGFLGEQRAQQIADDLRNDQTVFHCHKTVEYDGADDGDSRPDVSAAQHCAGAAIVLWKEHRPNIAMRLAALQGLLAGAITPDAASQDTLCFPTLDAFVAHHTWLATEKTGGADES